MIRYVVIGLVVTILGISGCFGAENENPDRGGSPSAIGDQSFSATVELAKDLLMPNEQMFVISGHLEKLYGDATSRPDLFFEVELAGRDEFIYPSGFFVNHKSGSVETYFASSAISQGDVLHIRVFDDDSRWRLIGGDHRFPELRLASLGRVIETEGVEVTLPVPGGVRVGYANGTQKEFNFGNHSAVVSMDRELRSKPITVVVGHAGEWNAELPVHRIGGKRAGKSYLRIRRVFEYPWQNWPLFQPPLVVAQYAPPVVLLVLVIVGWNQVSKRKGKIRAKSTPAN